VAWRSRRTAAENIAMWKVNSDALRNRWRSGVSIRTITTISNRSLRPRPSGPAVPPGPCTSFMKVCWPREARRCWLASPWRTTCYGTSLERSGLWAD
jgi:hypothetical protein